MYQQTILLESLNHECIRHAQLISHMEKRLLHLPQGSLACRKGYYYRILSTNGKVDQIPISTQLPDSSSLIHELQERRYILKALPVLKKNLECYKKALEDISIYDPISINQSLPKAYADFDYSKLTLSGDMLPETWLDQPYKSNTTFSEALIYESTGGLLTRSKAESMIATALELRKLSFQYEPSLPFGKHLFAPDFVIFHPLQRRNLYWEHFGLMDNADYAFDAMNKIRIYAEHGYRTGDNFIFTWETKLQPLTFRHINERINRYFH